MSLVGEEAADFQYKKVLEFKEMEELNRLGIVKNFPLL